MNKKRRAWGMGALATLLLAGTASAGQGVHLEFKHERLADRPMFRATATQFRLGSAIEKGEGVELLLRRESFEPRARRARVARQHGSVVSNGSLAQICQDAALPEFVAVFLGLEGACD